MLSPTASSSATPKSPYNICTPCRARKVACDGQRDTCGSCQRLGFTCSYVAPSVTESGAGNDSEWERRAATASFNERRRARQACTACRSRKMRCSGHHPACHRCSNLQLRCIYQPTRRSRYSTATAESSAEPPNDPSTAQTVSLSPVEPAVDQVREALGCSPCLLPSEESMVQLLCDFFTHLHPLPTFSFLHKVTVIQRYRARVLDEALLLSLVAITTLLTKRTDPTDDYSTRCANAAQEAVLRDIGKQSVTKVQTLLLLTQHRVMMRRFSDAFVLFSIASRMAYGVRLNFENTNLCFLARESRRRLMWALFIVDGTLASGITDFRLCSPQSIYVDLPCKESNFELDQEPQGAGLRLVPTDEEEKENVGCLALCIRVSWLRYRVLTYTKTVLGELLETDFDLDQIQRSIEELREDLYRLMSGLPQALLFSHRNMQLREYSHRLPPFIKLHILFHQTNCDLNRLTLQGLREALPKTVLERMDPEFVAACQRECFRSATALAGIFHALLTLSTKPSAADIDLPVCAYQCARLLFYSYRTFVGHLPVDSINHDAQACLRLVSLIENQTPVISYIYRDLERLVSRGFLRSSSASPEPNGESTTTAGDSTSLSAATPKQLLSRHSFIKDVGHDDESEPLTLPTTESPVSSHGAARQVPVMGNIAPRSSVSDIDHGGPSHPNTSIYMNGFAQPTDEEPFHPVQHRPANTGALEGDSDIFNFELDSLNFLSSQELEFYWLGR